jgi:hypothetical protein
MANEAHLARLTQGVAAWNAWWDENPDIQPDLTGAHLWGATLSDAMVTGPADRAGGQVRAPFASGISLTGRTMYWIVLSAPTSGATRIRVSGWTVHTGSPLGAGLFECPQAHVSQSTPAACPHGIDVWTPVYAWTFVGNAAFRVTSP